MTEEEIEAVAEELAKAGGTSWYPGRTRGALLRPVSERYRDRARLAIAALDRVRANHGGMQSESQQTPPPHQNALASNPDDVHVGAVVVYRPPGDQRAIACRIDRLEEGRAYLVPAPRPDIGWVSLDSLHPLRAETPTKDE
ncbi:hypothetical protein [Microvirga sp. VF16]|uniref:hypothetical protein n=1 Tax=Microvirga sp. VF16 TaxID=2807101 RepID=UPI00193E27EA|nr:hypothetical protein [Microvirga sp. VF16]QRM27791.1 hypothetical protein JO965_16155 [Microvirga sp. VF16]